MKNSKRIISICAIVVVIIIALVSINRCTNILMNKATNDIKNEDVTIETTESINEDSETLNFDINKSPMLYKDNEVDYIRFLTKYILPNKLANFVDVNWYSSTFYKDYKNGYEVIEYEIKYQAYGNLFIHLFEKDMLNFDDCPVTDTFKSKFKDGVYDYFKLDDNFEYLFDSLLDNNMFRIVASSYELREDLEPKFRYRINYEYKLDNDGNLDDIVFIEEEHSY